MISFLCVMLQVSGKQQYLITVKWQAYYLSELLYKDLYK